MNFFLFSRIRYPHLNVDLVSVYVFLEEEKSITGYGFETLMKKDSIDHYPLFYISNKITTEMYLVS